MKKIVTVLMIIMLSLTCRALDSEVLRENSITIDDFNRPTVSWEADDYATAVDLLDVLPYRPFEGSRSLAVAGTIKKTLEGELDQSRYFAFAVWLREETEITFAASSKYFEYECTKTVSGEGWQLCFFDLTDTSCMSKNSKPKSGKAKIETLSLSFSSGVLIDLCCGLDSLKTVTYLTDSFTMSGVMMNEADDGLYLLGKGYIEFIPAVNQLGNGTGIGIDILNLSEMTGITLSCLYENDPVRREYTRKISKGSEVQSVVFPTMGGKIENLRLELDGEIVLKAVYPANAYTDGGIGENITCKVGADGKVTINGEISDACNGDTLAVYAYIAGKSRTHIEHGRTVVSEGKFSVSFSDIANPLDYEFEIIDADLDKKVGVCYATNPEFFAENGTGEAPGGLKGGYLAADDYILDGLDCAIVEIDLAKLISANGVLYSSGMSSCYINMSYAEELDRAVLSGRRQSIGIFFRITATRTGDASIDGQLFDDNGSIKLTDAESSSLVAVFDWLTSRYSGENGKLNCLSGFILGEGLNRSATGSLYENAKKAALLYRVVNNAVKRINPVVDVYASVYCGGIRKSCRSDIGEFDCREFLTVFGDFICGSWKAALYLDDGGFSPADSEKISDFLNVFDEKTNVLLICPDKEGANGEINASGEFAECFISVLNGGDSRIKCIFAPKNCDYNNTLRYIDTVSAEEKLSYLFELYTDGGFADKFREASKKITENVLEKELLYILPSGIKGSATVFDFTSSDAGFAKSDYCSVIDSGVTLGDIKGILSASFEPAVENSLRGIRCKLSSPLDLSGSEYLGLEIMPTVLPDGAGKCDVTLIIYGANSRAVYTGKAYDGELTTLVAEIGAFEGKGAINGVGIYFSGNIGEPTMLITNVRTYSLTLSDKEIENAIEKLDKKTVGITTVAAVGAGFAACVIILAVRFGKRRKINSTRSAETRAAEQFGG